MFINEAFNPDAPRVKICFPDSIDSVMYADPTHIQKSKNKKTSQKDFSDLPVYRVAK